MTEATMIDQEVTQPLPQNVEQVSPQETFTKEQVEQALTSGFDFVKSSLQTVESTGQQIHPEMKAAVQVLEQHMQLLKSGKTTVDVPIYNEKTKATLTMQEGIPVEMLIFMLQSHIPNVSANPAEVKRLEQIVHVLTANSKPYAEASATRYPSDPDMRNTFQEARLRAEIYFRESDGRKVPDTITDPALRAQEARDNAQTALSARRELIIPKNSQEATQQVPEVATTLENQVEAVPLPVDPEAATVADKVAAINLAGCANELSTAVLLMFDKGENPTHADSAINAFVETEIIRPNTDVTTAEGKKRLLLATDLRIAGMQMRIRQIQMKYGGKENTPKSAIQKLEKSIQEAQLQRESGEISMQRNNTTETVSVDPSASNQVVELALQLGIDPEAAKKDPLGETYVLFDNAISTKSKRAEFLARIQPVIGEAHMEKFQDTFDALAKAYDSDKRLNTIMRAGLFSLLAALMTAYKLLTEGGEQQKR